LQAGGMTTFAIQYPSEDLVSEFVPSGYLSIREALNRLGRELFPLEWTGGENKARRNLMSEEDWFADQGSAACARRRCWHRAGIPNDLSWFAKKCCCRRRVAREMAHGEKE
jgi:hypothetical protein